jgi:hypothetical protein
VVSIASIKVRLVLFRIGVLPFFCVRFGPGGMGGIDGRIWPTTIQVEEHPQSSQEKTASKELPLDHQIG